METEIKGNKLIVTMDLTAKGTPSASGKSLVVESTRGFQAVGNGMSLSLNLTKKI